MSGWGDDHEEAGHEEAGHDETGHVPAGHQQSGHEPRDGEPCGPVTGGGLYGWEDELAASAHLHASSTRASGEHQRLDLDDADRLPWLESDEDDYIENISPGRVIVAGLVALLVVAAVVGGIWWTTHRHAVGAPLPDGSVVTPSPAQYKEAPADPGGKTYQGTGDTSYVVSQGQNRQAQLADGEGSVAAGSAPPPAAAAGGNANAGAAAKGGAGMTASASPAGGSTDSAPAGGVVQIGAFSSQELAEAGWSHLTIQHPMLAQQHHRVLQGQADIGTVWRLQVVTGAGGGAALCDRLRDEGMSCQVKR